MELSFIGRGSAFNVKEGNNCAFYKNDKNQMLLIDCGENIFEKIKTHNILDNVNELFILVSHTHSDHIGSLASLALFVFFAKKQKINLVLSHDEQYNNLLKFILLNTGVDEAWINYITIPQFVESFTDFKNIKFLPTEHVSQFQSFGFEIETADGIIYYSADTCSTKHLEHYLTVPNLDKIYMDTCLADYEGNVHVSLRLLKEIVPTDKRHKVFAMHLDNDNIFEQLKLANIAPVEVVKF